MAYTFRSGLIFLFLIPFFFISCTPVSTETATSGIIDLSSCSFDESGPAVLKGSWKFRYGTGEETSADIPSNWKGAAITGGQAGAFGYAEYSVTVLPPATVEPLMLKVGEIGTASIVSVNGVAAARTGIPGRTAAETVPDVRIRYIPLPAGITPLDISIRVSNFDDTNGGGIWGQISIGTTAQIERQKHAAMIGESFMAGLFFIVSLYYLVLFLYRRSDRTSILFALICASFFLRQITTGEKIILYLYPLVPWRTLVRFEYLSLYSLAPLYIAFFGTLFPRKSLRRVRALFIGAGIATSFSVVLLPVPWFIATLLPVQVYWLILFLATILLLIQAVIDRKSDAWIFLSSFSLLVAAAVNDILLTRLYLPTPSLVTLGQAVFIFFQSLALSRRFAREYRQSKNLSELNTHLRELDDAKTRFFMASSHELRTPVTLITSPLEAIMNGSYGETLDRNAPVFALVKRNCDRLKHVADELLDYLRFDSGAVKPIFRSVDLSLWLEKYAALFSRDASIRGLSLATLFDGAVVARVDPVLLETVVYNLVSNALKHTGEGGTITLATGRRGGESFFSVRDTGTGIPAEQLPHLFERFSAASAVGGTDYSGFGIGLPLSSEIVKSLGGTLSVSSRSGEGSVFTVAFPFYDGKAENTGTTENFGPSATRSVSAWLPPVRETGRSGLVPVLVVDDDPDMLDFLDGILSASFEVHTAISGAAAVSLVEGGFRPRVIVSDVMMPLMDGFALREKLSAMDSCASVPFLFLSAKADPEARQSGLATGAVDYILKPFNPVELSAKISSLASLARAERERLERKLVNALRNDGQSSSSSLPVRDWRERAMELGMTDRDLEVLALVIRGLSDKEIAAELSCSPRTVSNRISALLKKTGTPSRAGLMAFLTRVG